MLDELELQSTQIVGPSGQLMTRKDLPAPTTSRWVARRKAEVIAAVDGGLLSIREACDRYDLSLEEFASWKRAVEREGIPGLRATRVQHHRDLRASKKRGH